MEKFTRCRISREGRSISRSKMEVRGLTVGLALCFVLLVHRSQAATTGPLVRIPQGQLQGTVEDSIIGKQYVSFKGIPYGKPPVGPLRFKDPEPAGPWKSVRNASEFGPICAQLDLVYFKWEGSDDCLYLNVYTPPNFNPSGSPPKSVMVWIYGGSYNQGSGNDGFHGPDYLVDKDVVLVTINYRLGPAGFLNVEDEAATGNQGLKDQVLALKWVQRNIAYFGGDPNSVTIFGESSGSTSVHYLTLSPMAQGLFHKAIAQSGVVINPPAFLPFSTKLAAEELAASLGNRTKDPNQLVEFLRSIDAIRLAQANLELIAKKPYYGQSYFVPSVDVKSKNPLFPHPVEIAARQPVRVPFLLGYMAYEGMLFLAGVDEARWNLYNSNITNSLSPGARKLLLDKGISLQQLRDTYFGNKNISQATRTNYVDMQSDLQFIYGIHDITANQVAKSHCPTYLYKFSYSGGYSIPKEGLKIDLPGATHSDDVPYLFYPHYWKNAGIAPPAPGSRTQLVVDRVVQMWTDFAKTGNPTPRVSEKVPVVWRPVTNATTFDCMDIDADLRMIKVRNINSLLPHRRPNTG